MSDESLRRSYYQTLLTADAFIRPARRVLPFCSARPPHHYPAEELLSGAGAAMRGGRYNPIGLNVVYLSADPETAFSESRYDASLAAAFDLESPAVKPLVIVPVLLNLTKVFWLDRPACDLFALSSDDIYGNYLKKQREGSTVKTQALAEAMLDFGLEAIAFPSAQIPDKTNFAVFRKRVSVGVQLIALYKDLIPAERLSGGG